MGGVRTGCQVATPLFMSLVTQVCSAILHKLIPLTITTTSRYTLVLSQRCSTLLALQSYHTTALDGVGGKLTKEEKESLESPHFHSVVQKVVNSQHKHIIKSGIMPSWGLKMLVLLHFLITKAPDATDIQDGFLHFHGWTLWRWRSQKCSSSTCFLCLRVIHLPVSPIKWPALELLHGTSCHFEELAGQNQDNQSLVLDGQLCQAACVIKRDSSGWNRWPISAW